jgi:hypothetical protein
MISLYGTFPDPGKGYRKMTGKKMSRFDKMNFKIAQQQLRKKHKRGWKFQQRQGRKIFH